MLKFFGYTKHLNTGNTGRGAVILAKEGIDLTTVTSLPSGRGTYANVNAVNLCAPFETSERQARETFYNTSAVLTRISSTRHDYG